VPFPSPVLNILKILSEINSPNFNIVVLSVFLAFFTITLISVCSIRVFQYNVTAYSDIYYLSCIFYELNNIYISYQIFKHFNGCYLSLLF